MCCIVGVVSSASLEGYEVESSLKSCRQGNAHLEEVVQALRTRNVVLEQSCSSSIRLPQDTVKNARSLERTVDTLQRHNAELEEVVEVLRRHNAELQQSLELARSSGPLSVGGSENTKLDESCEALRSRNVELEQWLSLSPTSSQSPTGNAQQLEHVVTALRHRNADDLWKSLKVLEQSLVQSRSSNPAPRDHTKRFASSNSEPVFRDLNESDFEKVDKLPQEIAHSNPFLVFLLLICALSGLVFSSRS